MYQPNSHQRMSHMGRDSTMFRASSVSSLAPQSVKTKQHPVFQGSMQDVSIMGPTYHGDFRPDSLAHGTPLLQRFNDDANSTTAFPRESGIPRFRPKQGRVTTSVGSVGTDARASSLFPQAAPLICDPRPLANAKFQKEAMTLLHEFLVAHGFRLKNSKDAEIQFEVKALLPPSFGLLEKVFEFLMRKLLGAFQLDSNTKLDVELPAFASRLGYPYANALKPNLLHAPNISHSVPVVIGFLDWLREEAQVWMAMTSNSENAQEEMSSLFYRRESNDGTEIIIESVFHNARLNFMREACRMSMQSDDPDTEVIPQLFGIFHARMAECVGNSSEDAEALRNELRDRALAVRERQKNYESLEIINAKVFEKEQRIENRKRETQDLKFRMNNAEKEIVNLDREDRASESENKALREKIAMMEAKIRNQPMKKQAYLEYTKLEEAQQRSVGQTEGEIVSIKGRIDTLMREKAKYVQRLHDIVRELRDGLVEMDSTVGIDDLPYYNDADSVERYITEIKTKVESVIGNLRTRCEDALTGCEQAQTDQHRLLLRHAELKEEEKILLSQERDVRAKLAELEKQKSVGKISDLQSKVEQLTAQLAAGEALLLTAQASNKKLEKRARKAKKNQAVVAKYISTAEARDQKHLDAFINKQQERSDNLKKFSASMDTEIAKSKEVKISLESSLTAALAGKESENKNEH